MQQGGETRERFCSAFPSSVTESEPCTLVQCQRQSRCLDCLEALWSCQVYFLVSDHFTINQEALGLPVQQLTAESLGSQVFHSAALQTPHVTFLTAWSSNISTANHCAKEFLIHGKDPAKRRVAAGGRSTGGGTAMRNLVHRGRCTAPQTYTGL